MIQENEYNTNATYINILNEYVSPQVWCQDEVVQIADAGLGGIRGLLVQNPRQSPPHPPSSLRPRVVCSVSCFMDEVKLLENPRSFSITSSRSSPIIILIILPPFMHYLCISMPLAVRPYSNRKADQTL